jgi:PAS domain S-box-containing protein
LLKLPARGSLGLRFAWAAATLAAAAVLLVGAASWWWVDRLQRKAGEALLQQDAELHAGQVALALDGVAGRLEEIAGSPLLTTALTDSLGRDAYVQPYLNNVRAINAIPVELLFVDFRGQEIARNGDLSFSAEQRAWLRRQLEAGRRGATLSSDPGGEVLLAAEMVIYPRSKTVEGALLVKLSPQRLLLDDTYRVVSARQPPGAEVRTVIRSPGIFEPLGFAVERVAPKPAVAGLSPSPWAPLAIGALLIVSVVLIGLRLAERLTADLRELERFAGRLAEQAFGTERASTAGPREVASLAQSVNRMLDRLYERHSLERDRSEAQRHLLAACIERLNDIVMITEAEPFDPPGPRILFVNEAFMRLTGYARDEVIGQTPRLLQGPKTDRAELARIGESLRRWQPVRSELLNYRKDGTEFWVEIDIVPISDAKGWITHWVSVERDVTERRQAEADRLSLETQVREAQKMEAIGTLAGGVAHDFNNILGAILGNVALADRDLAEGRTPAGRLEQIRRSAGRARNLVDQILAFSRRSQPYSMAPQRLRPLVEDTVALLRATVPARVRLEMALSDDELYGQVDPTAIQQLLMNLATNAWHAMHGSSGHIVFGLAAETLPRPGGAAGPSPDLPPGRYARLSVADDGCGMDAQTQSRIFEPFFTTKPVGSGTGLGLSVVHGIVKAHHGAITLQSAPGAGTTFHIHLLLADPPDAPAEPTVPGPLHPTGRGERVLYIDDDEVLATMTETLLQGWGYRVTTAHDARVAIDLLRADPTAVDAVVTDFNMPELSGIDVLAAVAALRPDLPVILTSGYLPDDVRETALRAGASGLLRKESLHDELAAMLSRVLRGVPTA